MVWIALALLAAGILMAVASAIREGSTFEDVENCEEDDD